jgi:hypothetical protein
VSVEPAAPATPLAALLAAAGRPRWRGQPGRLEVHYLTATDTATGTGLWLHQEVVAPTAGTPYAHGWLAVFPSDGPPTCTRFGPADTGPLAADSGWFRTDAVEMTDRSARGRVGDVGWDLTWAGESSGPLWTFPQWAWRRQVLPAAQVVPVPSATVRGTVAGTAYDGVGGVAHIYGHGNAQRWVWLHADLGGGDVLEVVAATARRPALRRLPRLPLVQLRVGGRDWPADPLAAAPLFRASVDADGFRITGVVGRRRLTATVTLPADRCVELGYVDPDGATATCRNTERADADVRLEHLRGSRWHAERGWVLHGTAHAEIGSRP